MKITVVHCWSAPRSRSTALLYSFESRNDCVALDEPLYREWLLRKGDSVDRPYKESLLKGSAPEGYRNQDVWERELKSLNNRILEAAENMSQGGVIFCKHMAKHCDLWDFDNELSSESIEFSHRHLLLIRDPVAVLSSWKVSDNVHGSSVTTHEVGIVSMMQVFNNSQIPCVILDSDELAKDPSGALSRACSDLEISYNESMMSWKAGPHACDGK